MNFERLGRIVSIHKGKKNLIIDTPNESSVRVLQIDDLRNDSLLKYTDENEGVLATEGDLLIAWDGANAGTVGYGKRGYAGSTIAVLRKIEPWRYDTTFLGHFLKSQFDYLRSKATGATIPHIDRKSLENLKIPSIEIADQLRISVILNKAEELINKREKCLCLLDELLRSVFLNMFIGKSYNKHKSVTIGSLAKEEKGSMRTGPFGSDLLHSEFSTTGYARVIGIENVVNNQFQYGEAKYINHQKYEKLARYRIYPNDVLITIMGTTGRTAVAPEDIPLSINTKHLAAITLDTAKANPYFISYSLRCNPYLLKQLKDRTRGAIMDGLNLGIIKSLRISLPPIESQRRFEEVANKVNSLKLKSRNNLDVLITLFHSLSQKAFKGELELKDFDVNVPDQNSFLDHFEKTVDKPIKKGKPRKPKEDGDPFEGKIIPKDRLMTLDEAKKILGGEYEEISTRKNQPLEIDSEWFRVRKQPLDERKGIKFSDADGWAILDTIFTEKNYGFTSLEFVEFLRKEEINFRNDSVAKFFMDALDSKKMTQHYSMNDSIGSEQSKTAKQDSIIWFTVNPFGK